MTKEIIITFDEFSKRFIFDSLGLKKDKEFLVNSNGKRVKNSRGEQIKHSEFGGVLQGSKKFIKNETDEILEYLYNQI